MRYVRKRIQRLKNVTTACQKRNNIKQTVKILYNYRRRLMQNTEIRITKLKFRYKRRKIYYRKKKINKFLLSV